MIDALRIGIIGAGAVGGWFGGRLAKAGKDVRFLARGKTLETLRTTGLRLIDENGVEEILQVKAADNWDELGDVDVILVCTKALPGQDTFPAVPAGVPIVTTHNSVEVPHLAAEQFGEDNVLPGIIRGFFIHTGPAVVEFRPGPQSLNIGTFDGRPSELVDKLISDLHDAGLGGEHLPNIWVDIWTKAMFVSTFGALGALARQPIGYLRTELRDSFEALIREAEQVARGHGVPLADDIVEATLAFGDQQGPDNTTSMQRDIYDGVANELDAQVGAIRRMGDRVDVDTPLLDLVHGALDGRITAGEC
ncbi:2-dehydropantoate 2-reductase [Corynebacterium sp. H78]|uniref:2-dehydropantoate 2-reductase n=1 Tax=Corynebacterium sp. H78 TaxID=3133417 RepID=UPI00309F7DCC